MADPAGRARRPADRLRLPRPPARVLMLVGLSGGCYAVSLAAVAGLQSASDGALAAARAPYVDGLARLTDGHDRLEGGLSALADLDRRAVNTNDELSGAITGVEAQLDRLSSRVAAVDGAARQLPARAPMPVPVRSVGVSRSSGSAHATTGGSAVP
jgi:hypothetical protein